MPAMGKPNPGKGKYGGKNKSAGPSSLASSEARFVVQLRRIITMVVMVAVNVNVNVDVDVNVANRGESVINLVNMWLVW